MAVASSYRGRPACNDCGFCGGYGCPTNAKSSPAVTVLRDALLTGNVQVRYNCIATKVTTTAAGSIIRERPVGEARTRDLAQQRVHLKVERVEARIFAVGMHGGAAYRLRRVVDVADEDARPVVFRFAVSARLDQHLLGDQVAGVELHLVAGEQRDGMARRRIVETSEVVVPRFQHADFEPVGGEHARHRASAGAARDLASTR